MVEIYDFNDKPLSYKNGSYGGMAGSKDGILIKGEEWLLKYPKSLSQMIGDNASYSTTPISEYIGSHIYQVLGYDAHETILGEKNGKIVVACKDFATEKMLLEIRTIKNHTGKDLGELLEGKDMSSSETHIVNLDVLLLHLDKNPVLTKVKGIKERFFEQSIVDVLINNNDRNCGNWGLLRDRSGGDELAPIFDNGGSFSTKISDRKIKNLLNSPELFNNATNVLTAYGDGKHQYSAKTFFEKVGMFKEFQNSVCKVVPNIKSKMNDFCEIIDSIPETYTAKTGQKLLVMSPERKDLYKRQLEIRLNYLLEPQLELVLKNQQRTNDAMYMNKNESQDLDEEDLVL